MEAKQSATYLVYQQLREAIINLEYKPGERLSATRVAQQYGVSRSPAKEAMIRLESEGLVDIRPQYGTLVSAVTKKKANDICDVRLLLEPYAAAVAAARVTDEDITALRARQRDIAAAEHQSREKARQLVFETDRAMHDLVLARCDNAVITQVIEIHRAEIQRIRLLNADWQNRLDDSRRETDAVIEALCARDSAAARDAMARHIAAIRQTSNAYLV